MIISKVKKIILNYSKIVIYIHLYHLYLLMLLILILENPFAR